MQIRHFDKLFFKQWMPEMAYVLGYLFADGYVFTNPRGSSYVGFCSADQELIEKVRNALRSNHKIGIRKRYEKNDHWKQVYVLQIGSKDLLAQLKSFGIIQNKSLVIRLPNNIPENRLGHFLRGYFDGDGNVYFKKHWAKDRQKMRWVFSTRFTSGSKGFLHDIKERIKHYIHGGFVQEKERGYEFVLSHKDSRALFNLMYSDISSNLFLSRKYKIFETALATLYNMEP